MNENIKTSTFAAVAIVAVAIALLTRPEDPEDILQASRKGTLLFDFPAPKAKDIEVVEILNNEKKIIRVSDDADGWFIHRDTFKYPADADNQLGAMATSLAGLLIHDLESDKESEHAKYGVLDPNSPQEIRKAANKDEAIGKLVILKDHTKKPLAQLIIGKAAQLPEIRAAKAALAKLKAEDNASVEEIEFQEEELENLKKGTLRYARTPGSAEVISVKFDKFENISTKFVDWVEKDFLDLSKWDVKRIHFDNYETSTTMVGRPDLPPQFRVPKLEKKSMGKYTLAYADGNWTSPDLQLADGESIGQDVLDDLKDNLDDLEIIDVDKKPGVVIDKVLVSLSKGIMANNQLMAAVKSGKMSNDEAKRQWMTSYQTSFSRDDALLTNIRQSMEQKGFHLDVQQNPTSGLKSSILCDKGEIHVGMKDGVEYVLRFGKIYVGNEDDKNATGDSRYLYALARVNPSLLEAPKLEPVPASLPPRTIPPSPDGNATKSTPPGKKGPEGKKGANAKAKAPEAPPPPDANATAAYEQARVKRAGEIARIKASNAAKQKEYSDKLKKAKKRVDELNAHLASWYYVISNEVYDKIHLERKDFVEKKIGASHLLVAYIGASRAGSAVTRTKEEAKARAEDLRKQIVDEDKDFAEMARNNSDGPSASKGGDLEKFNFDGMAKPFSEAAFALKVGAVSAVVETEFGFHVIKRTE